MGYDPVRQGKRRPYATSDGYLCLMPYTDRHWTRFFELSGRADLAADPAFATNRGRQVDPGRVWDELGREVVTRTSAEWTALLDGSDIPHAVLNDLEDLLDDPHLAATGFWQRLEHPTEGALRLPMNPIALSNSPPSIRRLPPALGQHTEEILREHGFTPETIQSLAPAP